MSHRQVKEVPEVCFDCPFLDGPEYTDTGEVWSEAFCMRGLFLPTKKNACKVKEKHFPGVPCDNCGASGLMHYIVNNRDNGRCICTVCNGTGRVERSQ